MLGGSLTIVPPTRFIVATLWLEDVAVKCDIRYKIVQRMLQSLTHRCKAFAGDDELTTSSIVFAMTARSQRDRDVRGSGSE
jgi:hypothetical protein